VGISSRLFSSSLHSTFLYFKVILGYSPIGAPGGIRNPCECKKKFFFSSRLKKCLSVLIILKKISVIKKLNEIVIHIYM